MKTFQTIAVAPSGREAASFQDVSWFRFFFCLPHKSKDMLIRAAFKIGFLAICFAFVADRAQAVTITNLTTGQVLFRDNFEIAPSVSSGVYPDNTGDYDPVAEVGTWLIAPNLAGDPEPDPNLVQVTNSTTSPDIATGAFEGDNYLRMVRNGGAIRAFTTFAEQSNPGDVIRFEASLSISSTATQSGSGITAWDNTGAPIISMGFNWFGNTTNTDGTFGGSSVTTTYPQLDFTPGEWFHFAIDWTIGEDTFDMTVGDSTVTDLGLRYNATATTPTNIVAFALASGGADRPLYADAVPEPQAFALIAIGMAGLGMLQIRRRK